MIALAAKGFTDTSASLDQVIFVRPSLEAVNGSTRISTPSIRRSYETSLPESVRALDLHPPERIRAPGESSRRVAPGGQPRIFSLWHAGDAAGAED